MPDGPDYDRILLPQGLQWYDELGGQEKGWVCDANGPGWWHVEELNLEDVPCSN